MLCGCLDWDTSLNGQARKYPSFPGNRRTNFIKTDGNALTIASVPPPSSTVAEEPALPVATKAAELVAVRVPEGSGPGDLIAVKSPDGSGRQITAVIPSNVTVGQTFMVEFPPGSAGTSIPTSSSVGAATTNNASNQLYLQGNKHAIALPSFEPSNCNKHTTTPPTAIPVPIQQQYREPASSSIPSPVIAQVPVPVPLPDPVVPTAPPASAPQNEDPSLILVQVPPGVCAGQTLHVQVPGSDMVIAAQVPPGNVRQFHVAVPQQQQQQQHHHHYQQQLLVQVPPNTPPGTTLHVRVPNSNQIIAATVPPGNVTQFYVSYQPPTPSAAPRPQYNHQTQQQDQRSSSIYHPSSQPQQETSSWNHSLPARDNSNHNNTNNHYNQMDRTQATYNNNNNAPSTNTCAMSNAAPILAGAALMGAAGLMIGNHHNN